MIKLKIEATDGNDLRKQLQALLGPLATSNIVTTGAPLVIGASGAAIAAAETEEKPAEDPKPTRRKKTEPAKEQEQEGNSASEATEASSAPATTQDDASRTSDSGQTAPTDASPSDEVTIEQIRELTLKVVDQCGKQKIEEVLSQFGVARATQVSEELRPELAAKLQEALDEVAG